MRGIWLGFALALGVADVRAETMANPVRLVSEVRWGALAHDPGFLRGREGGAAINGEILFISPFASVAGGNWLFAPRPHLGTSVHLGGATNRFYAGLTWSAPLARGLFRPGDGLRLDLFGGGSVNDGLVEGGPGRKALGSNVLFRVGAELVYEIDARWSVSAFFDHDSNAGLARRNQALNAIGLRVGYRP